MATQQILLSLGVSNVEYTVSNNDTNINASTIFGTDFASSISKILIIPNGFEIGATTGNHVITVPTGMDGTLEIQNSGTISGHGGSAESAGGNAIHVSSAGVTIINSGVIRAGGGGGADGGDGGAGGNGSYEAFSHYTGQSPGSCTPYLQGYIFRGQNYPQAYNYTGDQLCAICHNGASAPSQGSYVLTANGTTGHTTSWAKTFTGQNWRDHSRRYWRFYGQGCAATATTNTTGGAGGTGGTGGVGQGYNQSAGSSNAGGSGAAAGGTNAGAGGDGGASGAGGAYGVSGTGGTGGSAGANGNVTNGAAGGAAGSFGVSGYYLFKNGVTATVNNTGTLTGLIN